MPSATMRAGGIAKALLIDLGCVGPVARRRTAADIEMVTERAGDRDRLAVDENRGERLDVRQVLTAGVRVVRRVDVTLAPAVERESLEHRPQGSRHRVEVHRDPRRLRHDATLDVEDRRRVVEHLANHLRVSGSLDRRRHLLGRGDKAVANHLQGDRVDALDRTLSARVQRVRRHPGPPCPHPRVTFATLP